MRGHPLTNTPDLFDFSIAQHPVALERVADINHTTSFRLQAFGGVVGQLCQGLGLRNTDTYRDAGAPQNLGAHVTAELGQIARDAGEVCK